ncbi:MAG: serine hydrolase [Candidatus Zhuqueibacterota bacterium]
MPRNHSMKFFFKLILSFLLLIFCSVNSASGQSAVNFAGHMHSLEKSIGGRIGIAARNLRTGETLAYKSEEKFPSASVIKVPVMVEYFYQVAEGKISPAQKMKLDESNKFGGSGLYQYFFGATEQQLIDAVSMMIIVSDNTATNLVLDALGSTHEEKLAAVNERMKSLGLKDTRLLNKLMSWPTKTNAPESIRYGVGVTTPQDMVMLMEKMYTCQLADSSVCRQMIDMLAKQEYNDMIPRLLPFESAPALRVAHKTGSVTGVANDIGLILSPNADIAIAIFCDQIQDRRESSENSGVMAAAQAARLVWNHFTGANGVDRPAAYRVDWSSFPGGEWTRIFLTHGLFPHPARMSGHRYQETFFPADPHYLDSSAVIFVPKGFYETDRGVDVIVHFHGWNNDVLNVMEKFDLFQQLIASQKNAILVLAQGPYRASDSHGGTMEDADGLKRFIDEIVLILKNERRIVQPRAGNVILSAHSGGYRPAIFSVERGGLSERIAEVFLFDAFYGETERLIPWLLSDKGHRLRSIYTEHLAPEHHQFMKLLDKANLKFGNQFKTKDRITLSPTDVSHNDVILGTFQQWLEGSCLPNRKPQ